MWGAMILDRCIRTTRNKVPMYSQYGCMVAAVVAGAVGMLLISMLWIQRDVDVMYLWLVVSPNVIWERARC
jgi:hypothetical protein